ncbi:hypothetical protein LZK73_21750 [Neorhizobium galegae]|nr:hypothetical protein LZK73_21750 [Neorhizobium galegae]
MKHHDYFKREIKVGDILCHHTYGSSGLHRTLVEVVGFTAKMIKVKRYGSPHDITWNITALNALVVNKLLDSKEPA